MVARGTIRWGLLSGCRNQPWKTRAEKLRMKLENESRGKNESREQPRTVEKVEKKLRKVQNNFLNDVENES